MGLIPELKIPSEGLTNFSKKAGIIRKQYVSKNKAIIAVKSNLKNMSLSLISQFDCPEVLLKSQVPAFLKFTTERNLLKTSNSRKLL